LSRFNNKTIVGPHNHVSGSLDSGNSTQDFIRSAAKDFGRTAIAITDHGMMSALLEAHDFSKELKKKENINITIIPGIEIYLQPDHDDPSLIPNEKGTVKAEYYHLTMHFSDFNSYLDGSKISKTSYDRSIWKGGELKPLWTWDELRSMSGKVTLTSGCMISPVGKNFMNNRKEVSERYFKRLKDIAGPGKFFAEILPYEVSKNWNGKTKTFDPIPPTECCPSGKLQVDVNKWIFHLSKKYNVPVIISEDAHYAKEEDKMLQDCLSAGTIITTDNGLKKIEDVKVGDRVLSNSGKMNLVEATRGLYSKKNKVQISMSRKNNFVEMTEDHLVLAKKMKKKSFKSRRVDFESEEPQWVQAKDLTLDHYVYTPKVNLPSGNGAYFDFSDFLINNLEDDNRSSVRNNLDGSTRLYPIKTKISDTDAYMLGLFLGDGYSKNGKDTVFVIDTKNVKAVGYLKSLAANLGDLRVSKNKAGHKGIDVYSIGGGHFSRWLKKNFYNNDLKNIPIDIFFSLTKKQQDMFVYGLYDADGRKNEDYLSIVLSAPQPIGIMSLWALSRGLIFKNDNRSGTETIRGGVKCYTKPTYSIYFNTFYSNKFCEIIGEKYDYVRVTNRINYHTIETSEGFYRRICYVKKNIINQVPVYDLQVGNDNNFVAEGFIVHNCRINKDGKGTWKMSDANCLHSTEWIYEEMLRLHPEEVNENMFEKWVDNSYDMLGNFKSFEPKFEFRLPKIVIDKSITQPSGNIVIEKQELSTDDELLNYTMELVQNKKIIDLGNEIYFDRLMREIDALYYNGHTNLARYMLFLNKVFDWCKVNDVTTGPGRGSAAGSLLAYALGITAVDPIIEDLSFERFFDATRIVDGLADIDSDFSDRSKVVDMLKAEYGDSFAYLGISSTFKTKSILKDVDRYLYGEVRKETEQICKLIPHTGQGLNELDFLNGHTDADGIYHEGFIDSNDSFKYYLNNNPQHYDFLMKMTKLPRQMGRHAAGVIISDIPVQEFIPMMKVSDEPTTQLMPKWVEKSGGVKYDILGLSTLEDIRVALNLVKKRHGYDIDPWKIPDDPEVWNAITEDPTTVFQFHTETIRPGLRSMKPQSVQEAAILTSVFRPGAMDAPSEEPGMTMADMFLFRWNNRQYVKYIHEDMKPIIESTVGVIVFQEQSMRIVHELGGLTMPETNQFRKAISKKSGDVLIKLLHKVKENLLDKGWSEDQVNSLVEQLKASGKYSFNKSHAISYSYVARACGFLKLYFPIEWWTAVLTNASKEDLIKLWPRVCNVVKMPDINLSTDQFQIVEDGDQEKILAPINFINGVGTSAISQILEFRPFTSLRDILERTALNRGVMFKLILSGTLDRFFKEGMNDIEKMQEYLNVRADVLGKKNPETVPEEYRNLTPIKEYLLMKSVYKVYFDNLENIVVPFLVNREVLIEGEQGVLMFEGANLGQKLHITPDYLQQSIDEGYYIDGTVVGFISSMEEKAYDNKKKKMMIMTVEIGDKAYEFIKFPDWGKDNHGLDKSIEDGICLFVISKKSDDGAPIVVKQLLPIENINFLKDAAEERKEKEKHEKAQRKISKSKGTSKKGS